MRVLRWKPTKSVRSFSGTYSGFKAGQVEISDIRATHSSSDWQFHAMNVQQL
jgi:hypothetical protein